MKTQKSSNCFFSHSSLHVNCFFSFQALMSLFVLASKDGWVNIMYNGLDAVAVDQQVSILSGFVEFSQ